MWGAAAIGRPSSAARPMSRPSSIEFSRLTTSSSICPHDRVALWRRMQLGESIVTLSGFRQYLRNFYSKIAFPLVTVEQAQRPFDHGFVLSPGEGHIAILMHFMSLRTKENDQEFDYESTNGRTVTRLACRRRG